MTEQKVPEWQRKVGYATNAAGMIGGPAAIWAATRNRKGGGIPRDVARSIAGTGKHQKRTKTQVRLHRVVSALDKPKSKKAAVAAGIAGSSMVGLQVANWAGDTIATRALSQQKKPKKAGEVMSKSVGVSAFGVVHEISKRDNRSKGNPSGGRRAAHAAFGGYHTLAVSPKGRRFKNVARDYGSSVAGSLPGTAAAVAGISRATKLGGHTKGTLAATVGGLGASYVGAHAARQKNLTSMNRKGFLRAEDKKKK